MFLLLWIRKLYKVLSADASPSAIAFGFLFGLVLGCIPLWSGLAMLLVLSLLVVRVQVSSALLAMAIGKLLSFAGLSLFFNRVGATLQDPSSPSLKRFWSWALNLPVVAWLDLHYEAILGGATVGLALGLLVFFPIRQSVVAYRRFLHERLSQNKFFKWMTNLWLIKGLRFVFSGPETSL